MARLTLGIDVGTTALKALLLDPERGVIARSERQHSLRSPHPGWAEMDPLEWWTTTVAAVRELLTGVRAAEIAAIGATGMVPAMVLLDSAGCPLRPSIQQNDARAIAEVEELRAMFDPAEFLNITGGMPNQQNVAPRWRWLARHEPRAIEQCATLMGSYDYITFRLSAERSLEENWAAESGFYDVRGHAWHPAYLEQARIDPGTLPSVHRPTDVVGGVSTAAAAATGLLPGTPVVAGSADHVAAALAAGLTRPGDVLLKFGGAGDILYVAERPDPDPHFYFDYHDIPGLALINGCMAASGSLVKWFAAEFAGGASPAELDREAAAIPPGAGGIVVLPYLLGEKTPIFDPGARGVFAGVMLHHTRAHLYRAVLESVCYGFRHHLDLLVAAGRPITRVLAADGGSRSSTWMQIAADVTGRELQVSAGDAASALGAAFVAGISAGIYRSWDDIQRFATAGPRYTPNAGTTERYGTGYTVYRELYQRLKGLFPLLREVEGSSSSGA